MKKEELGFKYGMTYVEGGCDAAFIDFADIAIESDFYEFLITLAEEKKIEILKDYEEEAAEELLKKYELEDISENMIVAKTYIFEMIENRLWREYAEGAKKALEENNYVAKSDYYFELKNNLDD